VNGLLSRRILCQQLAALLPLAAQLVAAVLPRRPLRRPDFEDLADLEHLANVLRLDVGYSGAAPGDILHEAVTLELAQRFPDRRLAHRQLAGELCFVDGEARPQLPVDDALPEALVYPGLLVDDHLRSTLDRRP
jgi:hypothetical protein